MYFANIMRLLKYWIDNHYHTKAYATNVSPEPSKEAFLDRLKEMPYLESKIVYNHSLGRFELYENDPEGTAKRFLVETWPAQGGYEKRGLPSRKNKGCGSDNLSKSEIDQRRIHYLQFRDWSFTGDHFSGEEYQLLHNPMFDFGLSEKQYTMSQAWNAQMLYEHRDPTWVPPVCFTDYWEPCNG